jgi:hypothetical protein
MIPLGRAGAITDRGATGESTAVAGEDPAAGGMETGAVAGATVSSEVLVAGLLLMGFFQRRGVRCGDGRVSR